LKAIPSAIFVPPGKFHLFCKEACWADWSMAIKKAFGSFPCLIKSCI
jgi:hypothetical protein